MDGTKAERLEIYSYTHPRWYSKLIGSAIVAGSVGVMLIIEADLREFWTAYIGWAWPVAIGFVIYAAAVIGIVRALKWTERFKQAPEHPSLVVDSDGLVTQWSARVPWTDVRDFITASIRGTSLFCVLVATRGAYPHPWWTSRTFVRWEPANALPMLLHFPLGYLVRRGALGPLEHIRNDQIIAELRGFRSHLGVGEGGLAMGRVQVESGESGERPAKRFVRPWDYAMIASFIGVAIAFYIHWLPPRLGLAALALLVLSFGLRTLYAGELTFRDSTLYRSRSPIMYWVGVVMIFSLGAGMFLGGL